MQVTAEMLLAAFFTGFVAGWILLRLHMDRKGWCDSGVRCTHSLKIGGKQCRCVRPKFHKGKHMTTRGAITSWGNK